MTRMVLIGAMLLMGCEVGGGEIFDEYDVPGGDPEDYDPEDIVPNANGDDGITVLTGRGADINTTLAAYLQGAGPGDRIRLSMYIFRNHEGASALVRDRLLAAARAGARIEVITDQKPLDNPSTGTEARQLLAELAHPNIDTFVCQRGCITDAPTAINHFKVWMIDIGGVRTLVQSTANLDRGGAMEAAAVLDGNRYGKLWNFYNSRLDLQVCFATEGKDAATCSIRGSQARVTDKMRGFRLRKNGLVRAYFSSPTSTIDYQLNVLRNTTPRKKRCRVRLVMGHWTNSSRGRAFVNELNRLHDAGCKVAALYGGRAQRTALERRARFSMSYDPGLHAKFMAIRGVYYGKQTELVWIGSANFTDDAGTINDESFVRIKSPWVYDEFIQYYNELDARPE